MASTVFSARRNNALISPVAPKHAYNIQAKKKTPVPRAIPIVRPTNVSIQTFQKGFIFILQIVAGY